MFDQFTEVSEIVSDRSKRQWSCEALDFASPNACCAASVPQSLTLLDLLDALKHKMLLRRTDH